MRAQTIASLEDPRVEVYRCTRARSLPDRGEIADFAAQQARERNRAAVDRIVFVLGSEGSGLSDAVQELADVRVRIGMAPGADSINVATAAGIALHRLAGTIPELLDI